MQWWIWNLRKLNFRGTALRQNPSKRNFWPALVSQPTIITNPIERPLRRFNLPIDICPKYFAQFLFAHLDICSNEICSKWRRHLPMKTLAQFHVSNYLCLALTFNYLLIGNTVGMVLNTQTATKNISITGFSYDLPSNPWVFQPKSMLDVGI